MLEMKLRGMRSILWLALLSIFLGLALLPAACFGQGDEVTVFGPKQYLRTTASVDVFTDSFSAVAENGTVIIQNGDGKGHHLVEDLLIEINGVPLADWGALMQPPYKLQAPVAMIENNSLLVIIMGNAGSYLTIQAEEEIAPDAIMGFENLGTWQVTGTAQQGFTVTSTTDRTQGTAAYSVANPPAMVKLVSEPVASSAPALAGIGNTGALLQVDIQIPAESSGSITAQVSSPSRGLTNVSLGQVDLSRYRAGIYNTISFSIPDEVSSALGGGATFSDLTFEFDLSSSETTGTYLFDNLRVHSVTLVQTPTGTPPPPGYGGSVNFDVFGNAPVTQTSSLGPTQIPSGFHLKLGSAGSTTVQLLLGLDGTAALTCTYAPDATDSTGHSYILQSCSNGFEAGDLVNSNWVQLGITGGDATQEIRAQLAMNPMGDLTGASLLPPMPTFWGDADTCVPAPVPGKVVTTSASCASQVAEANQIMDGYTQQVINFNPSPNWIVTPTPAFALAQSPSTANQAVKRASLTPEDSSSNTMNFSAENSVNSGGNWNVGWFFNGILTPAVVAGTDQNTTQFNSDFNAYAVLWGQYVSVMDATVTAETDSAETTPNAIAGTSSGNVLLTILGSEVPGGGSITPSQSFTVDPQWSKDLNLPSLDIWIFSLTLGATANAGVKVSSPGAVSGLNLNVDPSASLGLHVSGGVDIKLPIVQETIASGKVDVRIDLIALDTPMNATATWTEATAAAPCAISVNGNGSGQKTIGEGGGGVWLNASFGICPGNHCWTESKEVFTWPAIASTTGSLFDPNPTLNASFRLPPGLAACGSWQGTYSGISIACAKRDASGCCIKDGGTEVLSGPVSATLSQTGTSVSADLFDRNLTGTNTNGDVSLQTTVLAYCGTKEVPAGLSGTISSDGSTFSGSFYVDRRRTIVGTFSMQRTAPPQP